MSHKGDVRWHSKNTSAGQRPNGIQNWNLLMSLVWFFVTYLRQKSRCWTPSIYTIIKDWLLKNWFTNLVKTHNRGHQTLARYKRPKKHLTDQIEQTNPTDWLKLTNQRTNALWVWQPLHCKIDQSLLQTKFVTFDFQKIVQSTLMTSAQASV